MKINNKQNNAFLLCDFKIIYKMKKVKANSTKKGKLLIVITLRRKS